ncbi:MAG: InlB B-repeat-containing protein [Clostridiales bacterium]|jgi:uncharacterized repeat protein (TIGR02543 family)|nr:InlB B-repeat-containing protein [Clostridiales bacterium]
MKKQAARFIVLFLALAMLVGALTACETKRKVHFSADGAVIKTVETKSGKESVTLPDAPAKTGYAFDGWYKDDGVWEDRFESNTLTKSPIKNDITVYAKYTPIVYRISYIGEFYGAENPAANPASYTIESPTITLELPVRNGFTAIWSSGGVIPGGSTGNRTFTIEWSAASYTITYEGLPSWAANNNPAAYTAGSAVTLKNPSATGYIFAGWTDEKDDPATGIPSGGTGNRTFTANWTFVEYDITYALDNGVSDNGVSLDYPQTYNVGRTVGLPTPEKYGYDFAGWQRQDSIDTFTEITAGSITGNLTFTALWTPKVYYINYDLPEDALNDEANPDTYTAEDAEIVLRAPSRAGYNFVKWIDDGGDEVTIIPEGSVGGITLTAVWDPIAYGIVYNGLPATAVNNNPAVYTIEDEVILTNPSAEGYIFVKWTDGSGDASGIPLGSTGIKTFAANWTYVTYDITYEGLKAGADNAANPATYTVAEPHDIDLEAPTVDGYTFTHWTDEKGEPVTAIATGSTGNKVFTANWTLTQYGISYINLGYGITDNGLSLEYPQTYHIEEKVTLPIPIFDGRVFDKWTDAVEDTDTAITEIPLGSFGNRVFKANWNDLEYEITYVVGEGGSHNNPTTYTEFDEFVLTPAERPGYVFKEWLENEEKIVSITLGSTGNRTITAVWLAVYTVTYDYNGATGSNGDPTADVVESYEYALAVPTYDNFKFGGWFDAPNGGGTRYTDELGVSLAAWTDTSDKTLYAYLTDKANFVYENIEGGGVSVKKNDYTAPSGYIYIQPYYLGNPITKIADYGFQLCVAVTAVNMPDTVTVIGERAFASCFALSAISLPSGLTVIGDGAFESSGIAAITLPESVISIGASAFRFTGLTAIAIPDGVISIGASAFANCGSLASVTFGVASGLETIGDGAFESSGIAAITLPESVISIGSKAFANCKLMSIILPASVRSLGDYVFLGNVKIEEEDTVIPMVVNMRGINPADLPEEEAAEYSFSALWNKIYEDEVSTDMFAVVYNYTE